MNLDDWPDCPVEGCSNKICLALNSDKCFVHTDGNEHVKRWKIDARNAPEQFKPDRIWRDVQIGEVRIYPPLLKPEDTGK